MAKIPFNIKYRPQIESGEYKVETNDGRKVRIVCWDMINASYNDILALVASSISGNENALIYYQDGKCKSDSSGLGRKDLVIVTPEPEFTNWEKFISGCLQKHGLLDCGAADRIAKECNEMGTMLYDAGFEDGKEEALKDLPRWKKVGVDTGQTNLIKGYKREEDELYRNGKCISLVSLEKLPGFKEE